MLSIFNDGVWLVELAPLTDPAFIPQAIASVFELHEAPLTPLIDIVINYLRAKQLLLVLDNCEHLIASCAKLADDLLRVCLQLKIIASSREALGISGETVYRVPSLSLPDQAQVTREAILDYESMQLFVERAKAVQSHFTLTNANASSVAQICQRLDGIPLALELAAARTAVFSPEEIAARLDDRFNLLTGGSRAALEHHQTLQALIDWSYDLLSNDERTLLRHLSVFLGGWTLEAVEAVCSELDVLNLLPQLVHKSLVMADTDAQESSTRYHLLETIRQYARDKLFEANELNDARNRHLDFFLQFAEGAESHFDSPKETTWMTRLEAEDDNLRAALEWALENDVVRAVRLGTALCRYWNRHRYEAEGRHLLGEALTRLKALSPLDGEAAHQRIVLQAKALNAFGMLGFGQGDHFSSAKAFEESVILSRQIGEKYTLSCAPSYLGMTRAFLGDVESAYPVAKEGLSLAREVGDKVLLGIALTNMARTIAMTQGDPKIMQDYAEEGVQLLREAGARWTIAMASVWLGMFASMRGDYAEARTHFEACLSIFTELRDKFHINAIHSEMAHLERHQGHHAQAQPLYRETLAEWQRLGHRAAIAHELECFAIIAEAQEKDLRATKLFGAAEALRENINMPMTPFERVEYEREVSDLRANMDDSAFAKAWSEGRVLTMEQAIALATEDEGEDSPLPKDGPSSD
jgi:predicted ATPase